MQSCAHAATSHCHHQLAQSSSEWLWSRATSKASNCRKPASKTDRPACADIAGCETRTHGAAGNRPAVPRQFLIVHASGLFGKITSFPSDLPALAPPPRQSRQLGQHRWFLSVTQAVQAFFDPSPARRFVLGMQRQAQIPKVLVGVIEIQQLVRPGPAAPHRCSKSTARPRPPPTLRATGPGRRAALPSVSAGPTPGLRLANRAPLLPAVGRAFRTTLVPADRTRPALLYAIPHGLANYGVFSTRMLSKAKVCTRG